MWVHARTHARTRHPFRRTPWRSTAFLPSQCLGKAVTGRCRHPFWLGTVKHTHTMPRFTVWVFKMVPKILMFCTQYHTFSEQPTFINVGCSHHTFCMGRNYFANYFDFKNNFSPYKLYGGQPTFKCRCSLNLGYLQVLGAKLASRIKMFHAI